MGGASVRVPRSTPDGKYTPGRFPTMRTIGLAVVLARMIQSVVTSVLVFCCHCRIMVPGVIAVKGPDPVARTHLKGKYGSV